MEKHPHMKLLIGCLLFFSAYPCFGQFQMPSFPDVVNKFFTSYSIDHSEFFVRFQRKSDGWRVSEVTYTNPDVFSNSTLFWSKERNGYNVLNYPPASTDTSYLGETIRRYFIQVDWTNEMYQFQRLKYYGYPGWDWDIISEDSIGLVTSDSLLESYGRAYSNYASGFVAEQFGDVFLNNDSDRVPVRSDRPMSTHALDKFIFYEGKSLDAYTKLLRMNPAYETKVGNIRLKLANEYMFAYLELAMGNDSVRAKTFATKAIYPDSVLSRARLYLSTLPKNSLLITGGDNDTYPCWYLQVVDGFRRDVTVLNYSLLGLRKYLSFIDRSFRPRLFSTMDSTYLKTNFDYSAFSNDQAQADPISVKSFLADLASHKNPYDSSERHYKKELLNTYYSKLVYFQLDKGVGSSNLTLGNYLLMNEFMLMDIIQTSSTRPVFFTFATDLFGQFLHPVDELHLELVLDPGRN